MKTKQRPTAAAANAASVGAVTTTAKQRTKEEEPIRLRQRPAPQTQCERERKHEAARKEREAQAQLKRKSTTTAPATSTATAASRTRLKTVRMTSKEGQKTTVKASKAGAKATTSKAAPSTATKTKTTTTGTATTTKPKSSSASHDEETAQLRLQLDHLAQLSEQDFEREFRAWMAQEGIEGKVQAQVRMDLINSFNSTSLGKLLRKASASASASASAAGAARQRDRCLLLSPMVLALQTMVAEFLYVQNCHYTLSVFCSEMPHRDTMPNFERCQEFRFSQEELQQMIHAILGDLQLEFGQTVLRVYDEQKVSLLLGFFKVLVDPTLARIKQATTNTSITMNTTTTVSTTTHRTEATQTEPAACLPSRPDVDTSKLFQFQAEELIVAADGRTVFIGPRVSQSLNGVQQQLEQLMQQMRHLCKSCAPPVEVISQSAFEQLLQQELLERQRLLSAGQTLEPGKTALQLPEEDQQEKKEQKEQQEGNTVLSPAGPIQLPKESASVPKLPHLHAEQVASLAMVQQALTQLQTDQTPDCMYVTLERMEALVGELAGCIQTLSNVLNLAMEQEYAVGRHKGYKLGYREGFSHGHFMGVQEGMQTMEQELKLKQRQQEEPRQLKESSSQTAMSAQRPPPPSSWRSIGCQTPRQFQALRNAASQTTAGQEAPSKRSYEQWIYEMLHSRSGKIFLERVELSLNKALELQKKRLDELFDVKLRHHAELLRLSNRQSSWRTLCRHVERDSQSTEARDLVHKIFRLLEHYEAHHQLLAEKIQQTEQAAQHAAQIEPMWRDAGVAAMGCNVTPASCISQSSPTATGTATATTAAPLTSRLPGPLTTPVAPPATYLPSRLPGPGASPALGHPSTSLPTPAPGQLQGPFPSDCPGYLPTSLPASVSGQFHGTPAKTPAPGRLQVTPPTPAADPAPGHFEGHLPEPLPAPVPAPVPVPGQATSNPSTRLPGPLPALVPASTPNTLSVAGSVLPSPAVTMPTLFTQFLLPLAAETAASSADSPNRPLMLNAATNTQLPSNLVLTDARPQPVPSFNEALLSAKHRMLQLEQESDLLEQSFLGYLERARAQKQKLNCSREHQELQRTLDTFREWQATTPTPASVEVPVPGPGPVRAPAPVAAPTVSPIYSGSELELELEPESYQFTNAIAVARHKLLSELHATTTTQPTASTSTNRLLVLDQVQDETQQLLSRVEATLARVSKPASLQLLAAESQLQLQLEPLSSGGTHTSLERIATPPASRKLQRSMAKMQLLFGNQTEEQAKAKAKRPWSAPINKLNASFLPPGRPHTAPSSLTDAVAPAPNLLGLLDALSDVGDTTTNTSSLTSLSLNHPNHPNPQQLKSSSSGTGSHTSSSAALSPSQEFWKRMNM
ncbi:hypothetical protein ACLKA6_009165 [Drosophila palustris]